MGAERIRERFMPVLKTYDLFISHAWDYHDDYIRVKKLLDRALLFNYRNYSRPKTKPLLGSTKIYFQTALAKQINPANAVIILAGMYTGHSDWIQWEIDYARRMNKPIIAVRPWGQQRMPTKIQLAAKEVVGWNTLSIVNAIRRWAI